MNTPIYIKTHGIRRTKVSGATMAEIFRSARIEDGGRIPAEVRDALDSISRYGNPFGGGGRIKDNWIDRQG